MTGPETRKAEGLIYAKIRSALKKRERRRPFRKVSTPIYLLDRPKGFYVNLKMKRDKILSYLGFAARSGNLAAGYDKCMMYMKKRKIKLLILTDGLSANTVKKMLKECDKTGAAHRIFGKAEELSKAVGKEGAKIFGITDNHFAEIVSREIDLIQSEREVSQ